MRDKNSSYDPAKDEVLVKERAAGQFGLIEVAKKRYDGGVPKICLARIVVKANGDERYMQIGRLTEQESDVLVTLLMKVKS